MASELPFLDPAWIKNGFSSDWCPNGTTFEIQKASWFSKDLEPADRQNKAVIGMLLSVSTPTKSGSAYGMSYYNINAGKRSKMVNYAFIMVFADLADLPNCFAVILHRKSDFQKLFNNKANCEYITIGDTICFPEPSVTDDKLGETLTVVKGTARAVPLVYRPEWPKRDLALCSDKNRQVAFHIDEKKITLSSILLRTASHGVNCNNFMCDRQNIRCQGCYGTKPSLWPIVVQCDVTVHQVSDWNRNKNNNANFFDFRSWKFSNLLFDDLEKLCSMNQDDLDSFEIEMRNAVKVIIDHINDNGGWTVIGWHRRGIIGATGDESDELLSNDTLGHISCLMPSNPQVLLPDSYIKYTPSKPGNAGPPVVGARQPQARGSTASTNKRQKTSQKDKQADQKENTAASK